MSLPSDALPQFGRYEPLFRIAAGGMAEVFAARIRGEAGFEKLVAVKRMLPHLVEDEHFVDMFLDEARVAVHVASPHVVQTLDLGRGEDGSLYIAMELVVGCSLAVLIKEARKANQRVPIPIALEILAQAAQGLDDAHEAVTPTGVQLGIVHRDVSPHNLLVGADGRTRVTDFGIARALMRRTSTAAGELKGKFAYFSPEQADGQQVDRRSDVFALGIVAWETLLGRRLFTGDDMMQTLMRVRTMEIPLVHELDEAIPAAVSHVVAKALARKLEDRYATAHDFAVGLREVARTIGPTPRAREVGAWVNETGGEALKRIRTQIDNALAGDDVATIARVSSPTSAASGSHPKMVPASNPQIRSAPTPSPVVMLPASDLEPSTLISTTLPSANRPKSRAPLVIAAIVVLGGVGAAVAFAINPTAASKSAAPPSESAPFVAPTASTTAMAATASTSASATASAPTAKATAPTSKSKFVAPPPTYTAKAAPAPTPTVTATATATTPPPPPPPPATTEPPKKGPSGPILGDDAFKVPPK